LIKGIIFKTIKKTTGQQKKMGRNEMTSLFFLMNRNIIYDNKNKVIKVKILSIIK